MAIRGIQQDKYIWQTLGAQFIMFVAVCRAGFAFVFSKVEEVAWKGLVGNVTRGKEWSRPRGRGSVEGST